MSKKFQIFFVSINSQFYFLYFHLKNYLFLYINLYFYNLRYSLYFGNFLNYLIIMIFSYIILYNYQFRQLNLL